jgi:hypothetical protein
MSFNEFQMHLDTQLNDGLSEFIIVYFYLAMARVTIKQVAHMECLGDAIYITLLTTLTSIHHRDVLRSISTTSHY